ncbi:MAG: ArsB/NhaD family transporter [Deferrisomatales bacterium]
MRVLAPGALALLVLWAMMAPARPAPAPAWGAAAVLLVFLGTFGALALDLVGRLTAVALGAAGCLTLGAALGFYFPSQAAAYLWGKGDTLLLLAGIGLVTGLLQEGGFFERLARRVVAAAGGDPRRVVLSLCALTYGLSLLMNNLATILVIVPLSLRVAEALDLDPVDLVLGEIIASNLGGASTMIGDFPNMLIATETGLPFHDFLVYLAPVCLLELGLLLAVLGVRTPRRPVAAQRLRRLTAGLASSRWDPVAVSRGQAILAAMVAGFALGGWLGVGPGAIAAAGAGAALLAAGRHRSALVRHAGGDDVLFFACLFLMVGAVDASGALDGVARSWAGLWQGGRVAGGLALVWGAAGLTCFLNAGPTTALLVHLVLTSAAPADPAVWWALSLGVCAGSSATLTGATAGPVSASLLERRGVCLTFNRFARTGVPVMVGFLLLSSAYVVWLLR